MEKCVAANNYGEDGCALGAGELVSHQKNLGGNSILLGKGERTTEGYCKTNCGGMVTGEDGEDDEDGEDGEDVQNVCCGASGSIQERGRGLRLGLR